MTDAKPKILIIEDDLDLAEMLNAYFCVQGYEVFTVNWGEDGVRSCQTMHPDIVVLDIRLPDIDGYEVAHRLRGDRRSADIPIIFLTEKRDRADRLQGLELGGDDYITKPFDVQELQLRVRNSLKRFNQGSLTNPVTGLPDGALVDERLADILNEEGMTILLIAIENLDAFRESYGFVASDDVLRAISLMIVATLRQAGEPSDFLGHLSGTDLILIMSPSNTAAFSEQLRAQLEQSIDYFYPIKDRELAENQPNRLGTRIAELSPDHGRYTGIEEIKTELFRLKI